MRDNDKVIKVAKIISAIFNPFVVPFLAFLVLFFCSYLSMLPLTYRLIVLGIVYAFTILLPMIAIFFFRKINGWGFGAFRDRKKRFVPYLLTIICYVSCLVMMVRIGLPRYMTGIILATLMAMVICIVVNIKWKISEHMTAIGGVIGGLIAFSFLFNYNPTVWLSLFILLAGVLGSARIILRHHTLPEVLTGFAVGAVCAILGILYL
ncbi:hypothetical protein SAMN05444405_10559 [Bacteroides luti]|jgi:hypothetical protein|uniref:PAP2 superfamily protein n=1 Tax=Bacteroides luti TaxID=1297750 RepID=A0A1M4YRT7_9BACE|nr:hypothetical protein [Bacteroides luti]SHF08377.1 hypothetical protein SAMN05444405_10559 [Bacteroides luti]